MAEKKLRENALTTLEDMVEFMGMDLESLPEATKNNIIRLINAASSYIETVTGRNLTAMALGGEIPEAGVYRTAFCQRVSGVVPESISNPFGGKR